MLPRTNKIREFSFGIKIITMDTQFRTTEQTEQYFFIATNEPLNLSLEPAKLILSVIH